MANSAQVLYNQLPFYFRPVIEFQEILKAHGYALDNLEGLMLQIQANNYIATADEETIVFWERLLDITYKFGDTLEYRRTRVLQKFNTIVPFSIEFLRAKLTEQYGADGYELSVDSAACTITVKVTSDRYGAIDLLYDLLWDVIPAHLQVIANQETTNYISGRLNVGGLMSITFIQTILPYNRMDIPAEFNVAGTASVTRIQNIGG